MKNLKRKSSEIHFKKHKISKSYKAKEKMLQINYKKLEDRNAERVATR